QGGGSVVHVKRNRLEKKCPAFSELDQRLRARLKLRHRATEKAEIRLAQTAPDAGLDPRPHKLGEPRVVSLAYVMRVEVFQLLQIEAGWGAPHVIEVEPLGRLFPRNDLVVAVTPAQPKQIVEHRLRQHAELVAVGIDAGGAVPLR